MAYNVKTNSLTKEGGKTKRILLFNDSCKKGDMVVSVNNVFKLMNDVVLGDIYNGIVGKVEEDSENASTKPVLVTLFDDTMTVNVAVEDTETGEVVEATVQGNVLQDIVEETIEDIEEDKSYAYRFLNYDGTVLQQGRAMKGTAPTYIGSTPTRESSVSTDYTFSGWQPAIAEFDTDTDLVAQYSETARMYWVTFENYDGTTLQSTKVAYGETPVYAGETPTNPAGVFDGWTPEIAPVTGDATYMAVFIVHSYQSAPEVDEMTLMDAIEEDNHDISPMMIEGVKKVTSRLNVIISTEYLAGGEARNWSTDDDGMVFIQTNASSELVGYVFKTREELGADYNKYKNVFSHPENMTDEIWSSIQGFFVNTIHVVSSGGTTTIDLNGSNSITVNESTHAMRYNADYYAETNDTSTEYSTLDSKGWLIQGDYVVTNADASVYKSIVSSLKTKGIVNASITHDAVNGEITMANGQWSFTIMDKNLGATQVYQDGDTLSETNCGTYFQWGNNYGFPWTGPVTNSSTQVDTTGYGPGNYYSSSTFIVGANDWSNPHNTNLRGGVTDTDQAKQGPASSGYHVPSAEEWQNFVKMFNIIRPNAHSGNDFKNAFAMPFTGRRRQDTGGVEDQGFYGNYRASSPYQGDQANIVQIGTYSDSADTNPTLARAAGGSIRCFKNTATTPTFTFDDVDDALYNCPQIETALDVLNQVILSAPQIIADYVMSNSAQFGNEYSLTSTRGLSYTVVASGGVYTDIVVSHSANWGADNKASWNSSTGVWVNPNASANMNSEFDEENI